MNLRFPTAHLSYQTALKAFTALRGTAGHLAPDVTATFDGQYALAPYRYHIKGPLAGL